MLDELGMKLGMSALEFQELGENSDGNGGIQATAEFVA